MLFDSWNLFGKKTLPTVKVGQYEFVFYKETRYHSRLGFLNASSRTEGITNQSIGFGIKGVDVPPPFSLQLHHEMVSAAAEQGWVIHNVITYGECIQEIPEHVKTLS